MPLLGRKSIGIVNIDFSAWILSLLILLICFPDASYTFTEGIEVIATGKLTLNFSATGLGYTNTFSVTSSNMGMEEGGMQTPLLQV
jgi:hypothetical protein